MHLPRTTRWNGAGLNEIGFSSLVGSIGDRKTVGLGDLDLERLSFPTLCFYDSTIL